MSPWGLSYRLEPCENPTKPGCLSFSSQTPKGEGLLIPWKTHCLGAGAMTQQLKAPTASTEDPHSVLSSRMEAPTTTLISEQSNVLWPTQASHIHIAHKLMQAHISIEVKDNSFKKKKI